MNRRASKPAHFLGDKCVTIDAIGCQKEIVKLITQQNADYVITLKKNQGNLYEQVEKLFQSAKSSS